MRFIVKTLLCASLLGAIGVANAAATNASSSVQSEVLLQTTKSWDGVPYRAYPSAAPELTMLKITIPPHTALPWHTHPMPNAAYVLSGSLTVEKQANGAEQAMTKTITAGQVLPEMVASLHRGVTGDMPTVLIVFYAGTAGMPLSQQP